jgi:hypothetical protein
MIINHQQMHKDKFVTNYFIKGFPLYVFRQSILPSSGGHFGFVHRPMYLCQYWLLHLL